MVKICPVSLSDYGLLRLFLLFLVFVPKSVNKTDIKNCYRIFLLHYRQQTILFKTKNIFGGLERNLENFRKIWREHWETKIRDLSQENYEEMESNLRAIVVILRKTWTTLLGSSNFQTISKKF